MGFIIGLLTVVLILDCLALIFLVLIQLPKKEAGLGLAFGGGAADALFGAGSGTVLTKATKYAAALFFGLAVFLGVLQSDYYKKASTGLQREIDRQTQSGGVPLNLPQETPAPAAPATRTPIPSVPPAQTPPATPHPSPAAPVNPQPNTPAPPK
jgi:preprotein translocase subunit SecG